MSDKITIIIPTLNEAGWIENLLDSLTKQTDTNFEIVIVDASSTDDTIKIAQEYVNDLSITFVTSSKKNVAHQRNLGANKGKTSWIMFCDADNYLPPYFIQGIKYRIAQNKAQVFSTHPKPDSDHPKDKAIIKLINSYLNLQQNTRHPFCLEGMLVIEKVWFEKVGGFDPNISAGEGQALLKLLVSQGAKYTVHADPQFIFSLRRLRSSGILSTARGATELELRRLLGIKTSQKKQSKLYPMNYRGLKKEESSQVKKLINQLLTGID